MSPTKFSRPKDRWTIGLNNTALVVIDMQRTFVDRGAPLECVGARELVLKMNKLTEKCRKLKIPVIFVKANRRADLSDSGLMKDFTTGSRDNEMSPLEGKRGSEFCDGLIVTKNDYVVPKIRYNALLPGSSSLEPLLRGLGRDGIIICGVATDVCVGTTASTAMMLGFKVFFVGDLTTTFSEERQRVALEVYNMHFVKLMTFNEVMKELVRFDKQANK